MAELRTFIAVLLTNDLRHSIGLVQDRLRIAAPDVKWVAVDNFHVTMKFLGDVDSGRMDEIYAAVESARVGETPFQAAVSGVGAFPNSRRPQVVWVGLTSGVDRLAALAEKIESALEAVGFPKENRRFRAHITIGRVRPDRRADALVSALQSEEVGDIGSVQVSGIAVMKSDLRKEGPVYSVLREIPFDAPQGGSGC